jgi:hypothetical protein
MSMFARRRSIGFGKPPRRSPPFEGWKVDWEAFCRGHARRASCLLVKTRPGSSKRRQVTYDTLVDSTRCRRTSTLKAPLPRRATAALVACLMLISASRPKRPRATRAAPRPRRARATSRSWHASNPDKDQPCSQLLRRLGARTFPAATARASARLSPVNARAARPAQQINLTAKIWHDVRRRVSRDGGVFALARLSRRTHSANHADRASES